MKKKMLAVLLAATMCLSMGLTAFAASPEASKPEEDSKPSVPSVSETVEDISEVVKAEDVKVIVDGKEVEVGVKVTPVTDTDAIKDMDDEDFVANVVEANKDTELGKALLAADKVFVVGGLDLDVTIPDGKKADINVGKVDGIEAGDVVYALHYTEGAWEILAVEVLADGSVVLKDVSSTSPFVFVRELRAEEKTPEGKPADPEKKPDPVKPADKKPVPVSGKSPKTGDR